MTAREPDRVRESFMRGSCRVLDGILPGAGLLLAGRPWAGSLAILVWAAVVLLVVELVCLADLHPIRGGIVLGILWLAIQAMLLLTPLRVPRLHPVPALAGVAGWLAITGGVLFGWIGSECGIAVVPDLGGFPSLLPGEVLLLRPVNPEGEPPDRGDLVVAEIGGRTLLARVVGLPGEEVRFFGPTVSIDGTPLDQEPLGRVRMRVATGVEDREVLSLHAYRESQEMALPLVFYDSGVMFAPRLTRVATGFVYLLADNRSSSSVLDSREAGPVALSAIRGRPRILLWSSGERVRWQRIGMRVE
jgi:signal peptidase I